MPDPGAEIGRGLLLRHESAPALILQPDGTIDLPPGEMPRRRRSAASAVPGAAAAPAPPAEAPFARRRLSKRRTFLIFVCAVFLWFLSMFLTASILSS